MCWKTMGVVLCIIQVVGADVAWPGKTGPTFDGRARPEDARGVPTQWNEATGDNIAWKIPLEGRGHSTPVIGNGRIWLTSATEDGTKQFVYCIREADGEMLHSKLLFENESPEPLGNAVNSYASPTCVLTDDAVFVHFGTYGTARLDPATADLVWQRRDIHVRHFRGPGSSPVLHQGLLILTFDGIDQQFVTALRADTGDTVWRTKRSTDFGDLGPDGMPKGEGDLRKAYSTPAVALVNARTQVISVGSRAAFAYDVETGREIWTITHDDYNAAACPLLYRDTAILNTGTRSANLLAVRLDESTQGDVTRSHVVWDRPQGNSRLCFPVLYEGRIYSLTDNGVVTAVDAGTGVELFTGRVGGNFVASPVIANGLVYVSDEDGLTTVLEASDKFQVVAKNRLEEGGKASPAISRGALFLRTDQHLYKISQ